MNSNQRRKVKRYLQINYPYKVIIECPHFMTSINWEDKLEDMTDWCKKHAGKGCKYEWSWGDAEFHFSEGKTATHFTLRWS